MMIPKVDMESSMLATSAFREFIATLFPEINDATIEKDEELSTWLNEHKEKPFKLRLSQDSTGKLGISLDR